MRGRHADRQRVLRAASVVVALLMLPAAAVCAPYPFPAPAVQCRSDLAWLRMTRPDIRLPPMPADGEGDPGEGAPGEVWFVPAFPAPLPPAPRVWQQLQQTRYCGLARSLRHRVA